MDVARWWNTTGQAWPGRRDGGPSGAASHAPFCPGAIGLRRDGTSVRGEVFVAADRSKVASSFAPVNGAMIEETYTAFSTWM